jgi:hypothetical protein
MQPAMTSLVIFLKVVALAVRLHTAVPTLEPAAAFVHAEAAVEAATPRVAPELLLAVAFVESRFDATATSRVEAGTRHTGSFPSLAPPARLDPRASLYCGPLQTYASSWLHCLAERAPAVAYPAAVTELEQWLRDKRVRGSVRRALAGHGCGNSGLATGACNHYPERVLSIQRMFELGASPAHARSRAAS